MKTPIRVGITGGIGSGKSYVSNLFLKNHGIPVYNTDAAVKHDVIYRPHIKEQIIVAFGTESYFGDGQLNRKGLAEILFTDKEKLAVMNSIIKPEMAKSINDWVSSIRGYEYVLIECAIIYENELEDLFDKVIAVSCPIITRIDRLLKRGMTQENIHNVMKIQLSTPEIENRADYIIYNIADLDLDHQIKMLHCQIVGDQLLSEEI